MRQTLAGILTGFLAAAGIGVVAQALFLTATAPATATGTISLSASASATGLSSVRWTVDGAPIGTAITSGACAMTWDSRTVSDGPHVIHAVGRTVAGVPVSSAPVTVTVSNAAVPPPPPPQAVNCVGAFGPLSTDPLPACPASGLRDVTTRETYAITTPASNGGTACPFANGFVRVTVTPTACTPPAPPPTSAKFVIGDAVQVITTTVNVRVVGGGTLLGTQPLGAVGTVIGGPTSSNATTWWQIDYATGVDGWSGEGQLAKGVAPPPPPTPTVALPPTLSSVMPMRCSGTLTAVPPAGYTSLRFRRGTTNLGPASITTAPWMLRTTQDHGAQITARWTASGKPTLTSPSVVWHCR